MSQPWSTQDGQKWLAKALDPAGFQQVDLKGMPDQESHNVVLLNYQSQFAVEPPNMFGVVGTDASTYESIIYAYQDPLVFGVSASYPTGTQDPLHDNHNINLCFGTDSTSAGHHVPTPPSIRFNSTGVLFPRSCKQFINSQINGTSDLSDSYIAFKNFSQRHRVIYGALQAVPTCSANDNSGTISVSQQPFIGDNYNNNTVIGIGRALPDNANIDRLNDPTRWYGRNKTGARIYNSEDFPDAEDNIRNPASLLTRFYEGAYIPYKLKNPFSDDFITTGDVVTTFAPFWVVGAAYSLHRPEGGAPLPYVPMDWDMASNSFIAKIDPTTGQRTNALAKRIKLTLMSYTGAIKEIVFMNTHITNDHKLYTATIDLDEVGILNNSQGTAALLADNNTEDIVTVIPLADGVEDALTEQEIANHLPLGLRIYRCSPENMPRFRMPDTNVAAILCKSLNMKGNITLLFRIGCEIIVSGASVYSPFNHKSPAYDEDALKSYLRVTHRMSDAFYGNAATDAFHTGFYNYLLSEIYSPDETVDFANRGSYWRGVVSRA